MNIEELIGKVFGQLTVLGPAEGRSLWSLRWNCLCSCGAIKQVIAANLKRGHTTSCGHDRMKNMRDSRRTHGESGSSGEESSKEYICWKNMQARCNGNSDKSMKNYTLRGISVCERWLGDNGFCNFLADMGRVPFGMTLDRIDNNGSYCKENCRWTTPSKQRQNSRKVSIGEQKAFDVVLAYELGLSRTELSKMYGVSLQSIKAITNGKTYKDIISWR